MTTDNPPARYWLGTPPTRCDACGFTLARVFLDAATRRGRWGILCPGCHAEIGLGVGTGRGQRYERQPDGRWLKTAG